MAYNVTQGYFDCKQLRRHNAFVWGQYLRCKQTGLPARMRLNTSKLLNG